MADFELKPIKQLYIYSEEFDDKLPVLKPLNPVEELSNSSEKIPDETAIDLDSFPWRYPGEKKWHHPNDVICLD